MDTPRLSPSEDEQIMCLVDIREVVGDPKGKLMQSELVDHIRAIVEERDALRARIKAAPLTKVQCCAGGLATITVSADFAGKSIRLVVEPAP